MTNKLHNWKIQESNLEETTYCCKNCGELFYADESDFTSSQPPPRKGCTPEKNNE